MNPRFSQFFATFLLIAAVFVFLQQRSDAREIRQVRDEINELRGLWQSKFHARIAVEHTKHPESPKDTAAVENYNKSSTGVISSGNIEKRKRLQQEKVEAAVKRVREGDLAYYQSKLKLSEEQSQELEGVIEQADQVFIGAAAEAAEKQAELLADPQILATFVRKVKEERRAVLTEKSREVLNDDQYNAFLELLNNSPSPNPLFGVFQ